MVSRMPTTTAAAIARYDWGGPEGAPVLLLMHGLTDSGEGWADAVSRWSPRYRVLSWDARGHGTSARFSPQQLAAGVGETMAWDAVALLEELKTQGMDRPVLIGHSMGGGTAGVVAGLRPDLVSAVVLEDPALGRDPDETEGDRLGAGQARVRDAQLWREDPAAGLAKGRAENPGWPEAEYAGWARSKEQTDIAMLATGQARVARSWLEVAAAIEVPALLLACGDVMLWDDEKLGALSALANPQLTIRKVDGAGHCIRRTRTEAYHAIVDPWLADHT